MIIIMPEKGFVKHDEDLVIDKDYKIIDCTTTGGEKLYGYKGVKVIDGLQLPDIIDEEDSSLEKKDRAFERYIRSKAFRDGVLSLVADQVDIDTLDKNYFLILTDFAFKQYGEAFYENLIEVVGVDNDEDAPFVILYKKKDKEYFEDQFMKWIRKDIRKSTLKALNKSLKESFKGKDDDDDNAGTSYKDRMNGDKKKKKHKDEEVDLGTITSKGKDKDKKKKKKDKKKKKSFASFYDEATSLDDIKKGLKKISRGITLK